MYCNSLLSGDDSDQGDECVKTSPDFDHGTVCINFYQRKY